MELWINDVPFPHQYSVQGDHIPFKLHTYLPLKTKDNSAQDKFSDIHPFKSPKKDLRRFS